MTLPRLVLLLTSTTTAFAGSATLFSDSQPNNMASGSGSVVFDSYNATSITISVSAYAYGGSQQGGGRNYSGAAVAAIGTMVETDNVPSGSDPLSVSASVSLTVNKGPDGGWYADGVNMGSGLTVSASAYVSGEDAQGGGFASASVSWEEAPSNGAPSISWISSPGSATEGTPYEVIARGHDPDGNLVQVNVWKNSQPFAFAGGGNGTDSDSGNSTTDSSAQTVTFTAQAVDATGATSPIIVHTVAITGVVSRSPTIAWASSPSSVGYQQSYLISASGSDPDGNLAQVNIWKNGEPFAFAGGGNGVTNTSENSSVDSGPQAITYTAQAVDAEGNTSPIISHTVYVGPAASQAPTIGWVAAPSSVGYQQSYLISAAGNDADGNLAQVNIWRNGVPFAFAGGGNGFTGTSENTSVDSGPQTVTYTAQAVDSDGNASGIISHTVYVGPVASQAPSIGWVAAPSNVGHQQSYLISASGSDADGNLAQVNIWRNGVPFAFAGGGNGFTGTSENTAVDSGPQTVTYTAQAVDSDGNASGIISHTVYVGPAASQAPTIAWVAAPSNVGHQQSYLISASGSDADGNLAQVNIWRNGIPFAFAGGGNGFTGTSENTVVDSGPQTVTYTAQAVDSDGNASGTISHTVYITPVANQAPTIAWVSAPSNVGHQQSYLISASGSDGDGNLAQVNIWRNGVPFAFAGGGNGFTNTSENTSADSGPQTVTYTAQAIDAVGNISGIISHTVSVTPPENQAPTIAWLAAPSNVGHQQSYLISASSSDPDGNLAQVKIWKNGVPFAFAGGGNGFTSASENTSVDSGPQTVTYTAQAVDTEGKASMTISQTVVIGAALNAAPTVEWVVSPTISASGASYLVTARGSDADGNLTSVAILRDGVLLASANGGSGSTSEVSLTGSETGPTTVTLTAIARDFVGATSNVITHVISISPPVVVEYSLATAAGVGGVVSPGGIFASGATATITASPDQVHDFAGWTGDATGSANPLTIIMDRTKSVQAQFALKSYALTTAASTGGSVTEGGIYPYGTTVTLSATPDANYRFLGWSGDAAGTASSVAVLMTAARSVQAQFASKSPQVISFLPVADQNRGSGPITLVATASSGLPVSFAVLEGPATVSGSLLQITGVGPILIQANQFGDDAYLPAPSVTQSFDSVTVARLRYQSAARTLFQGQSTLGAPSYLINTP